MPQTFIEDPITPKAKAFIEAYHKAYNVNRIPSAVSAAQGYDAVYLFAAAVKQAGSTERTRSGCAGGPQRSGPRRDRRLEASLHPMGSEQRRDARGVPPRALRDGHGAGRKGDLRARGRSQRLAALARLPDPNRRGEEAHDDLDHRPAGGQRRADGSGLRLDRLGFQLTYATSKSINFGQASW